MESRSEDLARQRRRHRLLYQLEERLEPIMFALAFVWLWLFIADVTEGLSLWQQRLVTLVWGLFIVEYLLKLYLAPRRLRYVIQNWITLVALVIPAFRAFRLLRALRVLRLARVSSTTRIVRALTSTGRAYKALKAAQGEAPEPEMNVAVLPAVRPGGELAELKTLARQACDGARPEIESATRLGWNFTLVEPVTLDSGNPRRASDFLDEASQRMVKGPYDLVVVITDVGLVSRRRQAVAGLVSSTSRVAVLSMRELQSFAPDPPVEAHTETETEHQGAGGRDACRREACRRDACRWNASALLLHLLGHIGGLSHRPRHDSEVMSPFVFRDTRRSVPQFRASERETLARAGRKMPERELHGGGALAALVFHILMTFRHLPSVVKPLLRNRAPLLPLSLPGLATAAVAPSFVLVFSAEMWDVGLRMTNGVAIFYAAVSVLGASFYLAWAQALFLPRRGRGILTEHLAVANSVIFLSILLACIGLFVMVGVLMILIELYIFPPDLVQTWPTIDQPEVTLVDNLRLAAFISTVGVTTGALAGGFENRAVIRNLALFEDES